MSHLLTALISAAGTTALHHYRSVILAVAVLACDWASRLIPDRRRPALFRHHTGGHVNRRSA